MQQYIGLVSSVDPDWQTTKLDPSQLVRGSWSLNETYMETCIFVLSCLKFT